MREGAFAGRPEDGDGLGVDVLEREGEVAVRVVAGDEEHVGDGGVEASGGDAIALRVARDERGLDVEQRGERLEGDVSLAALVLREVERGRLAAVSASGEGERRGEERAQEEGLRAATKRCGRVVALAGGRLVGE